jgi:hypothetical protein
LAFIIVLQVVISLDGSRLVDHSLQRNVSTRQEATQLGHELADILKTMGADAILAEIRLAADSGALQISDPQQPPSSVSSISSSS